MTRHLFLLAALALLCPFVRAEPREVTGFSSSLDEWRNPDRNDEVMPVKLYYPKTDGPWPVVIVSHGLGGSREGLAYVGKYWAAHGYVSVHLQHVGSDQAIFRNFRQDGGAGVLKAASAEQLLRRTQDVKFAIDRMEQLNADPKSNFHKKLNVKDVAVAGHSFGAITAEVMCGQILGPTQKSYYDPRIKAGIIFSPSPPKFGDAKTSFAKISVPMFHWTGTRDDAQIPGDATIADRRVPFDSIDTSDQYLVILKDGDHMVFNGRIFENNFGRPNDAAWHDLIQRGTTSFLDAYLKGDERAKAVLQNGEFEKEVAKLGTFEKKPK